MILLEKYQNPVANTMDINVEAVPVDVSFVEVVAVLDEASPRRQWGEDMIAAVKFVDVFDLLFCSVLKTCYFDSLCRLSNKTFCY